MEETVQFTLNRKPIQVSADGQRKLLWVLRYDLGLTGPKFGCGDGRCGACTVLVDGEPVKSCQVPLAQVQGKSVVTIEGLADNGKLHPVQAAFVEHDALQCGFCTPGMIMSSAALLQHNPDPTAEDARAAISGHICRCGTYPHVIAATLAAAKARKA